MIEIRTKYLGPTDTRGSRIKASTQWRDRNISATVSRDYSVDAEADHKRAIMACIAKLSEQDKGRSEVAFHLISLEGGGWMATNFTPEIVLMPATTKPE
jgi:hypothetical protein